MKSRKARSDTGLFTVDDFIKSFYFEADFIKLYPFDSLGYFTFKEAIKILLCQENFGRYMTLLAQMPEIYGSESDIDCIFSSLLLFFLRQTKKTVVSRIFGDYMVIPPTKLNFLQYTAIYIQNIMRQYESMIDEKIGTTGGANIKKRIRLQIMK